MKEEELTDSDDLLHMLGKKCKSKYTLADLLIMEGLDKEEKACSQVSHNYYYWII